MTQGLNQWPNHDKQWEWTDGITSNENDYENEAMRMRMKSNENEAHGVKQWEWQAIRVKQWEWEWQAMRAVLGPHARNGLRPHDGLRPHYGLWPHEGLASRKENKISWIRPAVHRDSHNALDGQLNSVHISVSRFLVRCSILFAEAQQWVCPTFWRHAQRLWPILSYIASRPSAE